MPELKQEGRYVGYQGVYPLVEYAQKIGKNTAELTANDMAKFTVWWMAQQPRKDILAMAKSYTTKKYQDAQTSRLAEQGIESPINDGEEEIVIHNENEIVCTMELTQRDVEALKWALKCVLVDYSFEDAKNSIIETSLKSLLEGVEGVET
jgi:hypothetical protein